jgi:DNA-binding beta-propeller fold protein YncE
MSLRHTGAIELPAHVKPGGFDHAAIHHGSRRLYVAHTANDAVDVIDCETARYLHSIPDLSGVAGVLVSEERNLVFTSNRGENMVGIFSPENESSIVKIPVGIRPNGLAYDAGRDLLLAANVGDPAAPNSFTVSMVDVGQRTMVANFPVPGRTRWAVFVAQSDSFYINIADPGEIVVVDAIQPTQVARRLVVPAVGPHGLDFDPHSNRLFCACDGKTLLCLDRETGAVTSQADLTGVPDVIFFNPALQCLYVAIGEPGLIEVFDTHDGMKKIQVLQTEKGAHTIALDSMEDKVYAFLPISHQAIICQDE